MEDYLRKRKHRLAYDFVIGIAGTMGCISFMKDGLEYLKYPEPALQFVGIVMIAISCTFPFALTKIVIRDMKREDV